MSAKATQVKEVVAEKTEQKSLKKQLCKLKKL